MCLLSGCDPVPASQTASELSQRFSVEIRGGDPATFFVAPYQSQDAVIPHATMTSVGDEELSEALVGVNDALAVYPADLLSQLIDAVFICGELKFDGIAAAGTYGPRWLIISATPDRHLSEGNYRSALLGVHHELSSLVYERTPHNALQWQQLMPAGWQPATSYQEALRDPAPKSLGPAQGFLRSYGQTTMENDFNTYAEMLFSDPQQMRQLAELHPKVRQKLGVVISAYLALSPELGSYFEHHQLTAYAPPAATIRFNFSPTTTTINGSVE